MYKGIKRAKRKVVAKSNQVYLAESIRGRRIQEGNVFTLTKHLSPLSQAQHFTLIWHSFKTAFSHHIYSLTFFPPTRGQKTAFSIYTAGGSKETKHTNKYLRASSSCTALNICNYSVQHQAPRRSQGDDPAGRAPSCAKRGGKKNHRRLHLATWSEKEKAPWFISALSRSFARSPFNRARERASLTIKGESKINISPWDKEEPRLRSGERRRRRSDPWCARAGHRIACSERSANVNRNAGQQYLFTSFEARTVEGWWISALCAVRA